jgi:hypothetical protein
MAAPTLSNFSPVDGETYADIADVSVIASPNPGDNSDPVDLDTRQIFRDGIPYTTNYLALPGNAFLIYANVGLFPGETDVEVSVEISSEGASLATDTWNFDCREGMGVEVATDILAPVQIALAGAAALHIKEAISIERGQIVTLNSRPNVASDPVIAHVYAVVFGGGFDFALARISATREIRQLLALVAAGVGAEEVSESLRAARLIDGVTFSKSLFALRMRGEQIRLALESAAITIPAEVAVLLSLAVTKEQIAEVLRSFDVSGGDSLIANVDLVDLILSEGR